MPKGTIAPYASQLAAPHYQPLPAAGTTLVRAAGSIVCAVTLTKIRPSKLMNLQAARLTAALLKPFVEKQH
jgi:hypothetical protein